MSRSRQILHLDMDAFFAAVEVLDRPELRGRPVIVGGTPEGRGVVSTASYEARRFGVHSAMPAATAVRLCPQGVFLRPRMERYAEVSRRIFRLLGEYTPLVEPISIDEAFLDVTGCRPLAPAATDASALENARAIALEIQARVESETGGLTCSLGVASNKFVAKVASDLRKPRGLVVVPDEEVEGFLAPLSIERIWGVGPKTAAFLRRLGLARIGDLQKVSQVDLQRVAGRELGMHLALISRGIDERPVASRERPRSISRERTYGEFIPPANRERIERELIELSEQVAAQLRGEGLWGRTVHLKVRDERFNTLTRALTLEAPARLSEDIGGAAIRLFQERVRLQGKSVRLLGVGASGLVTECLRQLDFFESRDWDRDERLAAAADAVRERLGEEAILPARLLEGRSTEGRGGKL